MPTPFAITEWDFQLAVQNVVGGTMGDWMTVSMAIHDTFGMISFCNAEGEYYVTVIDNRDNRLNDTHGPFEDNEIDAKFGLIESAELIHETYSKISHRIDAVDQVILDREERRKSRLELEEIDRLALMDTKGWGAF